MKSSNFKVLLATVTTVGVLALSCNKNEDPALPPIGGFNKSDEVAAVNLTAKWSFDGSLTESKGNITGTSTNTAFATGKKGQAYQGSSSEARYAVYNVNPTFSH